MALLKKVKTTCGIVSGKQGHNLAISDFLGIPFAKPLDYKISQALTICWMNLVKTGDPNGDGLLNWPTYTAQTPYAMHFGNEDWKMENIILSGQEQRTLAYTQEHPGRLTSLEGFFTGL